MLKLNKEDGEKMWDWTSRIKEAAKIMHLINPTAWPTEQKVEDYINKIIDEFDLEQFNYDPSLNDNKPWAEFSWGHYVSTGGLKITYYFWDKENVETIDISLNLLSLDTYLDEKGLDKYGSYLNFREETLEEEIYKSKYLTDLQMMELKYPLKEYHVNPYDGILTEINPIKNNKSLWDLNMDRLAKCNIDSGDLATNKKEEKSMNTYTLTDEQLRMALRLASRPTKAIQARVNAVHPHSRARALREAVLERVLGTDTTDSE